MPKPQKLKPYVVRLEWASTISYCDVLVSAKTPQGAVRKAYEECDYDHQDNYDDGGESYATACVPFRTFQQAEACVDSRSLWDFTGLDKIPLKDQDPSLQAEAYKVRADMLAGALQRALDSMARTHQQVAHDPDTQTRLENDIRKARYVLDVAQVQP